MNKQKTYLRYVFWPAQIIALMAIIFTSPNWKVAPFLEHIKENDGGY